jgi:hypothetical protein
MPVPRVRFTVRRMMMAMAVVAILMGLAVGLRRRAERFKRLSFLQSVDANRWENLLLDRSLDDALASAILEQVHWHDAMAAKYDRVAQAPWRLLEPPPPIPRTPDLPAPVAAKYTRGLYPFPPPP